MTIATQDRTTLLEPMDRAFTRFVNLTQGSMVKAGVLARRRSMQAKMAWRSSHMQDLDQRLKDLDLDPAKLSWGPLTLNPRKAEFLLSELQADPPVRVLEAGSGTSTALLASLGLQLGFTVLSLENHAGTVDYLNHVLDVGEYPNLVVQLCGFKSSSYADGTGYRWYNADLSVMHGQFDVVVIDGPMGTMVGRNGALPEVVPYLAPTHRIFLDDSRRSHERACIEEWKSQFPGLQVEHPISAAGMAVLRVPPHHLAGA